MNLDELRQQSMAAQEQQAEPEQLSLLDRTPLFKDLKPRERFLIALMIFFNVVILGFGCMLVADRMMP